MPCQVLLLVLLSRRCWQRVNSWLYPGAGRSGYMLHCQHLPKLPSTGTKSQWGVWKQAQMVRDRAAVFAKLQYLICAYWHLGHLFSIQCLGGFHWFSILQTSVQVPAPAAGVIEALLVPDGGKVEGGTPLFKLRKTGGKSGLYNLNRPSSFHQSFSEDGSKAFRGILREVKCFLHLPL